LEAIGISQLPWPDAAAPSKTRRRESKPIPGGVLAGVRFALAIVATNADSVQASAQKLGQRLQVRVRVVSRKPLPMTPNFFYHRRRRFALAFHQYHGA